MQAKAKRQAEAKAKADKDAKSGKLQLLGMKTKRLSDRAARASRDDANASIDDEGTEQGSDDGEADEEEERMKNAPAHVRLHSSWSKSQAKKDANAKKAPGGMSFKPKFFTSRKSRKEMSARSVESLYQ